MAAARTIRELLVSLGVKTDKKAVEDFDKAIASTKANMLSAAKAAAAVGAAVAAAGTALFATAVSAANYGDGIDEAAQRTGVSAQALQELSYAADLAGVSTEELQAALAKQARTTQDAIGGSKDAAGAFKKLGISGDRLKSLAKDQGALFEAVADGLVRVKSEGEQIDLVQSIFGQGGTALLPLLKSGKRGIAELREQARKLGIVMDDQAIAASVAFSDALDNLKYAVSGLKNSIGAALLPVLTPLLQRIQDWFVANRGLIQQRIELWAERFGHALDGVVKAGEKMRPLVEQLGGWEPVLVGLTGAATALGAAFSAIKIGGPLLSAIGAIGSAIAALGGLVGAGAGLTAFLAGLSVIAVAAHVFAIIAAAVAAAVAQFAVMALVVDDVLVYFRGGKSVVGDFAAKFRHADGILGAFARRLDSIKRLVLAVADVMRPLVHIAGILAPEAFAAMQAAAVWAIGALNRWLGITDKLQVVAYLFNNVIAPLFDNLTAIFNGAAGALEWLGDNLDRVFGGAQSSADLLAGLGVIKNDALGALGQQFAPTAALAGAGGSTTNNHSMSQALNIAISGAGDPQAVGDAVAKAIQTRAQQTYAALFGGDR